MIDYEFTEVQSITTVDGESLILTGDFYLLSFAGYGAPPVEWLTRQGYKQVGQSVIGYNVQPRTISLTLTSQRAVTRDEFWELRRKLLEFFRPNRSSDDRGNELILTVLRADNTRRSIRCFYGGGAELDGDTDNNFLVNGNIQLVCYNPIWFGASSTTISPQPTVDDNLVFPITFPIQFGLEGSVYLTGDLLYDGTWRSFPTITLVGPYSSATIENLATGVTILLSTTIQQGEERIITLSEEGFTIVDQDGVNRFNELQAGSNLIGLSIKPESELPEGAPAQQIKITLVSAEDGISSATVTFFTRYFGI